jgi:hypothetical protein
MFNRIAVEFVPEGMTAEEARASRSKRPRTSNGGALLAFGALIALVAMVAVPVLLWQNGHKANAEIGRKAEHPATLIAKEPQTTPTETPAPTASPTATQTPTPTERPEQAGKMLLQDFNSPIATPRPDHPDAPTAIPAPTITPTEPPSPTPLPPYENIYHVVWPENNPGASYHVSGWVVEADGTTPRPVAMELCYQDGCLEWPRPGANDVATGYYEFLVSPGYWTLKVKDSDGPEMGFQVYPDGPARYEMTFRFNGNRPVSAARSNPWDNRYPTPVGSVASSPVPTPTATPAHTVIYLPVVVK